MTGAGHRQVAPGDRVGRVGVRGGRVDHPGVAVDAGERAGERRRRRALVDVGQVRGRQRVGGRDGGATGCSGSAPATLARPTVPWHEVQVMGFTVDQAVDVVGHAHRRAGAGRRWARPGVARVVAARAGGAGRVAAGRPVAGAVAAPAGHRGGAPVRGRLVQPGRGVGPGGVAVGGGAARSPAGIADRPGAERRGGGRAGPSSWWP